MYQQFYQFQQTYPYQTNNGFIPQDFNQQQQYPFQHQIKQQSYSQNYQNIIETLYFEPGDGEIFVYFDAMTNISKMVTCIDISTLFKEKRAKAITIVNFLSQVKHANLTYIYSHYIVDEKLIYLEMESPQNLSQWKTFCKKKFQPDEIFMILKQIAQGLEMLHSLNFTHRDVHPSRIQCFNSNIIKFNSIGLPYNFKKLLKRDNFSGHINYSAPELILEKTLFTPKVDIWSLGCCLYYLYLKKDPFDAKDPNIIKQNILNQQLDINSLQAIPLIFKPILEACFCIDEELRPTASHLIKLIDQVQASFKIQNQIPLTTPYGGIYQQYQSPQSGSPANMDPNLQKSRMMQMQQLPQQFMQQQMQISQQYQVKTQVNQNLQFIQEATQQKTQQTIPQNQMPVNINIDFQKFVQQKDQCQAYNVSELNKQQQNVQDIKNTSVSSISHEQISLFDNDLFVYNHDTSYGSEKKLPRKTIDVNFSDELINDTFSNSPLSKNFSLNLVGEHENQKAIMPSEKNKIDQRNQSKISTETSQIIQDNDGNTYEGEIYQNSKHGQGKQIFRNGDIYEGQWRYGFMEGEGKYTFNSGDLYIGQFSKGKKHGKGKLIYKANDDEYEGDWLLDKMTGKGKFIFKEEQKEYEGDYVEGAPYGYGKMKSPSFNYEGYFKSGLFEGQGKLEDFNNNTVFEGEYYDGKRRGYGKLIDLETGDIFEGDWREDLRQNIKGKFITINLRGKTYGPLEVNGIYLGETRQFIDKENIMKYLIKNHLGDSIEEEIHFQEVKEKLKRSNSNIDIQKKLDEELAQMNKGIFRIQSSDNLRLEQYDNIDNFEVNQNYQKLLNDDEI